MDASNSDIILQVLQFLAVPDLGRLAATSKRFLFLVRRYQTLRGPQLVASSSRIPQVRTRERIIPEMCKDAVQQLQSTPNLALYFGKAHYGTTPAEEKLPHLMPKNSITLGVTAPRIQCCISSEVECSSHSAIMLGSFPNVTIHPFLLHDYDDLDRFSETINNSSIDCEVCIIFACGEDNTTSVLEWTIETIQTKYPQAAIVGGVCTSGFVSQLTNDDIPGRVGRDNTGGDEKYVTKTVEDGIFGILLGGDVPVRSIVSRGMNSMTFQGPPQPETSFWVHESQYLQPGDEGFPFVSAPPLHKILTIEDRSTGKAYTYQEMMSRFGDTSIMGIRDTTEDGFTLYKIHELSVMLDSFLMFDTSLGSKSLHGKNIDLFELSGDACLIDMDLRMQQLQNVLKDEQLLGALMFSCNGRGPESSQLIKEEMADAKRFRKAFPNVPCLGFYCNGEIGPLAQAARKEVFQVGKAALQGFTVVFAVFIVPRVELSTINLDDSEESIGTFVTSYFHKSQTKKENS